MARPKKTADTTGWAIIKIVGSDKAGWYYATNVRSTGRGRGTVTVCLTKDGRHLCLTCRTHDTCEHSKFVSDYITTNGLPEIPACSE